ncbi:MAG: type I 3-dehydroquinate dehydratase [Proteobacteria bacterium]|nr:type I 3-dehydroquinate dehydratase [Pseudomonadota bacterium]MBU1715319.1 type I 3-dehydroquinate dehydratase [Pseudomonadota bacterium]
MCKLCVAIALRDEAAALIAAREAERLADVIEIRLDALSAPRVETFINGLAKPLIFTNRAGWEGGSCVAAEDERVGLLADAARAGAAYVDIELRTDEQLRSGLMAIAREHQTKVIVSWHDFKVTASAQALISILQEQYRSGADIGKIVTMARDFQDVLRVLDLQVLAAEMGFPLIAFCMGRVGMISRLATMELNGYMTYAALEVGLNTAPGQLSAKIVRTVQQEISDAS